ncbi:nuclear transport factor 2 family protein [Novosphingobium sp. G106]|uniref:nuclear transport factor 2 family protein n=1 Tax=Novosphingobium sp. G106 TaxID=2849500 RepID=UPI001C2D4F28|nr:nuclear transport factor 2 family protein [Novosphingobium sp. G106]MBV1690079.1 nuclear transport factor 2 family protein [Novosphingobium sp. G106]
MDRDQVLAIIDQAYAARQANDEEALGQIWAEDATFELAGETSLLENFPGSTGPEAGKPAVEALMRLVAMSNVTRLNAVVEGNKAATLSSATVSFAGRPSFETLLYDLWEINEAGRVRSLQQFADTARVVHEMRALKEI